MRKLVSTVVFIMSEVVLLCVIGATNSVPLGNLCVMKNYGDLAFFLGESTCIALAILCIHKGDSDNL